MKYRPIPCLPVNTSNMLSHLKYGMWIAASVDFNEGMLLPSLIKQLRSILEKYPDDGQILKVSVPYMHMTRTCIY